MTISQWNFLCNERNSSFLSHLSNLLSSLEGSAPASISGDPALRPRPVTGYSDPDFHSLHYALLPYAWVVAQITLRTSYSVSFQISDPQIMMNSWKI
jgi:hypothetical protein